MAQGLNKYSRALDLILCSVDAYRKGKLNVAARFMQRAAKEKGLKEVLSMLDNLNEPSAKTQPTFAKMLATARTSAKRTKVRADDMGGDESIDSLDDLSLEDADVLDLEDDGVGDEMDLADDGAVDSLDGDLDALDGTGDEGMDVASDEDADDADEEVAVDTGPATREAQQGAEGDDEDEPAEEDAGDTADCGRDAQTGSARKRAIAKEMAKRKNARIAKAQANLKALDRLAKK